MCSWDMDGDLAQRDPTALAATPGIVFSYIQPHFQAGKILREVVMQSEVLEGSISTGYASQAHGQH